MEGEGASTFVFSNIPPNYTPLMGSTWKCNNDHHKMFLLELQGGINLYRLTPEGYDWSSVKTFTQAGLLVGTMYASAQVRMTNATHIFIDYSLTGNYSGPIDIVKILPSDSLMNPAGPGKVTIEMPETYVRSGGGTIESNMHAEISFLEGTAKLPFREIIHIDPIEYTWNPTTLTLFLHTKATVRPWRVGGVVVPIDKFGLLAPCIGLASTMLMATVTAVTFGKRAKRRKGKQ
jgi:hypothetical protein